MPIRQRAVLDAAGWSSVQVAHGSAVVINIVTLNRSSSSSSSRDGRAVYS